MTEVHPEFDGEWFVKVNGRTVCAPSLASLQRKLGADVTIKDYYPNGFHDLIVYREPRKDGLPQRRPNAFDSMRPVRIVDVPEPPEVKAPTAHPTFEGCEWSPEHDARALELHGHKFSATAIGNELGRTRNAVIGRLNRLREAKTKEIVRND